MSKPVRLRSQIVTLDLLKYPTALRLWEFAQHRSHFVTGPGIMHDGLNQHFIVFRFFPTRPIFSIFSM
jgi:hypothetical protein